jgi:uncharacterized membrane protein (Fun14 family)
MLVVVMQMYNNQMVLVKREGCSQLTDTIIMKVEDMIINSLMLEASSWVAFQLGFKL